MNVVSAVLNTPHALIAGTTGSGKSVLLNSVICEGISQGYDFWFIDLKRVELSRYKKTKNCMGYATEPEQVIPFLDGIIDEMDEEYSRMDSLGMRESDMPHRYLVVDELADLVSMKGVLERLVKLGRLGRAAHIHTIGATQDPSRKTLSGQLMQNITCAVALRCRSAVESRQIVGKSGAELLPRYGRGLVWTYEGVSRVNIPMTPAEKIEEVVESHKRIEAPAPAPQKTFIPQVRPQAAPVKKTSLWPKLAIIVGVLFVLSASGLGIAIFAAFWVYFKLAFGLMDLFSLETLLGSKKKKKNYHRW